VLLLAPGRHGDGATTAAVVLAATLASSGPTLLLELNFRRPSMATALGLSEYTTFTTLLHEGEADALERAAVTTPIAGLHVLPNRLNGTGRSLPDMHGVADVVKRLRERFRYVVIDAAPVLGYPDTALLASVADGVLLLAAADATPLDACVAARRELERNGATLLGAVLTRQRKFVPEFLARRLGEI
jgi:receptor protein-tyrosine kinase